MPSSSALIPASCTRTLRATGFQSPHFSGGSIAELSTGTLAHFDLNWNVIGISRMIVTPEKLRLRAASAGVRGGV